MKKIRPLILNLVLVNSLLINSCGSTHKVSKQNMRPFLLEQANDTTLYEVKAYKLIDSAVNKILDSAIEYTKDCKYFDSRIPYLHAFQLRETDNQKFEIWTNISIQVALKLHIPSFLWGQDSLSMGGFFYKGYLFTLPLSEHNMSFVRQLDYNYFLKGSILPYEVPYDSYLYFEKVDNDYKIVDNKICGRPILIK